jgi:hypothetical protein
LYINKSKNFECFKSKQVDKTIIEKCINHIHIYQSENISLNSQISLLPMNVRQLTMPYIYSKVIVIIV